MDRVFTIRGFGAVVTGTLFSGSLHLEDRIDILPSGRSARVRGLQVHSEAVPTAVAGQRTAVNLQGVDRVEIQRGDIITTPGRFPVTHMLDVTLKLLDDAPRPWAIGRGCVSCRHERNYGARHSTRPRRAATR